MKTHLDAWVIVTALVSLHAATAVAAETELEILRREFAEARREAEAETQATGKVVTPADKVFSDAKRERRIAQFVADLTILARLENDLEGAIRRAKEAQSEGASRDEIEAWLAIIDAESSQRGKMKNARIDLTGILGELERLRDPRAVRLIAPLLAEKAKLFFELDYTLAPAQIRAAESLSNLARRGIIEKPREADQYGGFNVEHWRKWWAENREKFAPVPEPLGLIDEGRAPAATPQPAATPAATPPPGRK